MILCCTLIFMAQIAVIYNQLRSRRERILHLEIILSAVAKNRP